MKKCRRHRRQPVVCPCRGSGRYNCPYVAAYFRPCTCLGFGGGAVPCGWSGHGKEAARQRYELSRKGQDRYRRYNASAKGKARWARYRDGTEARRARRSGRR